MNLKNRFTFSLVGLLLTTSASLGAVESDFNKEVRVDAKRQSIDIQKGIISFFDDVTVNQGTLQIFADTLQVEQSAGAGKEVLIAVGKPAKFSQVLENGQKMHAEAAEIRYRLADNTIQLTGAAVLTQQDSVVKGETIHYDIAKQKMVAESGTDKDDRVTTIFLPEQLQQQLGENKE
ncbi:lipopolysaccharide transport periplasmic protein LptA [Corallincola spongiicola]|uniref:Lipopolysaccharide export system protein LptA n=1 Tax=Corallincola spongiicola TaxID=2520508 RepID=A0ABY1WNP8_9GAMM|nr:lipopolysaccharide transport periplasmic protein LptA [Corallincola spongiicola]TAA45170.1 lipopolysaccharide transport periplasmic protein LptA [Corallincola spongiicola]